MSWPRKVFLESTALFQLGNTLQKPEFAKLLEHRQYLEFELLVSEVSWAEYVRQRSDKLDELAIDIQSAALRLEGWNQDPKDIKNTLGQLREFKRTVGDVYKKRAKEIGIQILETPDIDVRRLFRMSIDRVLPFEQSKDNKSEKGFRDALIMFTILTDIKEGAEANSLVVTNDELLAKGLVKHADEFKTALTIVSNLDEANTHIEARVSEWYRKHLRKESEQAKAELAKYEKEIFDQVNAIRELSDYDLGIGPLFGSPLEIGESIERVTALKIDGVDSAVWGDKDKAESRILFRVRCSATLVTSIRTPSFFSPTKYSVGAEKPSFLTASAFTSFSRQERERTLPVTLYGEAKFQKTNGGWKLTDIRIDKSIGVEGMVALSRVAQQAN